jgi:hypothetical protein
MVSLQISLLAPVLAYVYQNFKDLKVFSIPEFEKFSFECLTSVCMCISVTREHLSVNGECDHT